LPEQSLKYPSFDVRLRTHATQTFIFDIVRRKWLVLTPEEWVRQHVINYLIREKNISASVISVEKELILNDLKKRYDIVVFDRTLKPWLVIECKAPYIALDQNVVAQALRYNLSVNAELVMITNGISDLVFNRFNEIVDLPAMTASIS
jgi:hypothetical protein